jgi:hypothetical protein
MVSCPYLVSRVRGFPKPRRDGGLLLVPVLPGTALRSVEFADAARRPAGSSGGSEQRSVLFAASIVAVPVFVVVAAVLVFVRGSGSGRHVTTAAPPPARPAPAVAPHRVQHTAPAVTTPRPAARPQPARDPARAQALRLASHLPVTLASTALLRVGGALYAVGGTTSNGAVSNRIWRLDLATGAVKPVGTFVEPLTDSASAVRGGVLYLVGGWTGSQVATGVLRWTPAGSSALVTRLPSGHRGGSAAFLGGRLYVSGGSPHGVFSVDVDRLSVTTVSAPPKRLETQAAANLDYLIAALRGRA